MARRILNRKEMREDFDAAERRKLDGEATDESEVDDKDEEEEEVEGAEDSAEEEKDEAPKKAKPAAKPKSKPRSRTPKIVRMKVVWGVFNNSNQRVAVFDYPKRQEAEELAAKLKADKRSTHFVQAVKEPMETKKAD
jgi:hypothetical protein